MKPVVLVGPGSDRLRDRLAAELAERGSVGTIRGSDDDPQTPHQDEQTTPSVTREFAIGDDHWRARGESLSLESALDDLATNCEFAIVTGFTHVRLPTVVLGEPTDDHERVLLRADAVDAVDTASLADEIEAVDSYETLSSLVAQAKASADEAFAGAIATFTGRVRAKDDDADEPTEHLRFERYDGVAQEKMATIREELQARDGVYEVLLHHRTGLVKAGEDIVYVVVLAGHRPEAFATVEDGIDRLKEEVPLFKKEVTVNDEFWAHEHSC